MLGFRYHDELLQTFPDSVAGVVLAREVQNQNISDALREAYLAEQEFALARIGNQSLADIPSINAWRRTFRKFGVDPTQYRSAAEALLRRLRKKGDIPHINALVDMGNLVSIRYGLPLAVFNVAHVRGPVTVRFAKGTERFTPLGGQEVEHPEVGEVVFVDEADEVLARRWCWRQSNASATHENVQHVMIVVEAQHAGGKSVVEEAVGDIVELLGTHDISGAIATGIVDIWNSSLPREH